MNSYRDEDWRNSVVPPERPLRKIKPGMSIFLGTGQAEPRTLVKSLIASETGNLQDLELIQLVSFGEAVSHKKKRYQQYRLKTFFPGWVSSDAISSGQMDLILSRFDQIPNLMESGKISIDAAFVQITPPNKAGYCSLGLAVDVARIAMEQASFVVGEINSQIPFTFGDTFVHISDFDMLVQSDDPPFYLKTRPKDDNFDKVAQNVASVIEDGSCIGFSFGSIFESLVSHLSSKRDLGIHTPFFSDNAMELIQSGAVSNRRKAIYRGKSVTSYAFGTENLSKWLDRNPLVEFQGIDKVFNPLEIGRNPNFVAIIHTRKIDLSGRLALHRSKTTGVVAGSAQAMAAINGATFSKGGYSICALTSRNRKGESNIVVSAEAIPNVLNNPESIDMVATEYGVAVLSHRTLRERAQALIEVAHPDDRRKLLEEAKKAKILYQDQIFLEKSVHLYPSEISARHTFKNGLKVRFRATKPSDEEQMRRLFYRFSDQSVYYRYFTAISSMPHTKMQEYVNVDYSHTMSIVGLIHKPGEGFVIAEARYVKDPQSPWADAAFIVDEKYKGYGIGTYLFRMLIKLAKERGLKGFTAEVLSSNTAMMKVFERGGITVKAKLEYGTYDLKMPFS